MSSCPLGASNYPGLHGLVLTTHYDEIEEIMQSTQYISTRVYCTYGNIGRLSDAVVELSP